MSIGKFVVTAIVSFALNFFLYELIFQTPLVFSAQEVLVIVLIVNNLILTIYFAMNRQKAVAAGIISPYVYVFLFIAGVLTLMSLGGR